MKRRVAKIIAYVAGSLIALLVGFHIWFIHHAEGLLEDLVASQSNGKIKLQVKHFRFNWFSSHMQLRQAVFYSTDTATATTSYRFSVYRIHIGVREIFPLIFDKKIVIDSLGLVSPDIHVTRLRAKDNDSTDSRSLSMPQEMGRVYKSIQDALQVLSVSKFHIDNGSFTLVNKIRPQDVPVTITNIQLHLDNLKIDTTETGSEKKILFSDNVALQTKNQNIVFPDGRHRLSFSNFGINIAKKLVEFDSCTIAATKEDSSQTSFKIFFDKLRLTNIDFDTLYLKEIIKADSVYCINPRFRLDAQVGKKAGSGKGTPKLNELIQQMTGDLRIEFVIVQNGSFDINTVRDGKPSSFTSSNNNFEMKGLRIDQASAHPLTVRSLAMAIRNYENFLRDSTYALQFDSVLLVDNSINLSNFSVKQLRDGKTVNDVTVPHFQLMNFSWDDLVFEKQLSAGYASLYKPDINYSFVHKEKNQNLFKALAGIGDIVQLSNLYVTDGRIRLLFADGTRLSLEGAQLYLAGRDFVQAAEPLSLQHAVRSLRFAKGRLESGNIVFNIENADISGTDSKLTAGRMIVSDKAGNISVDASDVVVGKILSGYNGGTTSINDIRWSKADIVMKKTGGKKMTGLIITNLSGTNTHFASTGDGKNIEAWFDHLSASEFALENGKEIVVRDLNTKGHGFTYANGAMHVGMEKFAFIDNGSSSATELVVTSYSGLDSLEMRMPSVKFIPDINAIVNGRIIAKGMHLPSPQIKIRRQPSEPGTSSPKLPYINVADITIQNPDFTLDQPASNGFTRIEWKGKSEKENGKEKENGNLVQIDRLRVSQDSGIRVDNLGLSAANFLMEANGQKFDAGQGRLKTVINNFSLRKNETGDWSWRAGIKDLEAINFLFANLGKNSGRLNLTSIDLSNLDISSSTILSFRRLLMVNRNFSVSKLTGTYETARVFFSWKDATYSKASRKFSVDSFQYRPALPKNEFLAGLKYQADYTTLVTNKIALDEFDIDRYLGDTIIWVKSLNIDGLKMENYRDKHLPFKAGIIKPLPAAAIAKIPVKIDVGNIKLTNARVSYAELSDKTNETGIVTFTDLNATTNAISNMKNAFNDSLVVNARAVLLDSFPLAVSFRQSYRDTAGGFAMDVHISGASAQLLNPVTSALGSVRIDRGTLDSLHMHATGTDKQADAEMKMVYRDLKVKLLNNASAGRKKRTTKGFISFIANTFAIKNNNRSRTAKATFERVRDKSVFHYLWKTTLKAIAASIGLKKT